MAITNEIVFKEVVTDEGLKHLTLLRERTEMVQRAQEDAFRNSKKFVEDYDAAMRKALATLINTVNTEGKHNKELAAIRQTQQQLNRVYELEATILRERTGSYNALSAELELVTLRLKQLSNEEINATKEGQRLVARQAALRKELEKFKDVTEDAESSTNSLVDQLSDVPGAAGQAGQGVKDLSGNIKALLRNPVVLVISAIVAALAALSKAFLRSEEGAKLLDKATAVFNATMSTLTELSVKAVEAVRELFSGGLRNAVTEIGTAIKDNIINRFEAIPKILGAIGVSVKALATGDFELLKKSAEGARDAVFQIVTGLDEQDQSAISEIIKETADRAVELTNAYERLARRTRELRVENAQLTRTAEQYATAEAEAAARANDTTLSFRQQQEALTELEEAQQKRLATERRIAQNNVSLITEELRLRRSSGEEVSALIEQQASALSSLEQVERELTVSTLENSRQRREILRDDFERQLDFAIDFYDAQKTQLERQISAEQDFTEERNRLAGELLQLETQPLSEATIAEQQSVLNRLNQLDQEALTEREALLNRFRELDESAFQEQIQLVEDFTGQRLNLQELALEDDERIVRERLRQADIDDVTLGRILEIFRERKAAVQDLADAERDLSQTKFELAQEEIRQQLDLRATQIDLAMQEFEQLQELEESKFNLSRNSGEARRQFELEQEREKLLKILELNEEFNQGFSDAQIETLRNLISAIDRELSGLDNVFTRFKTKFQKTFDIDDQTFQMIVSRVQNLIGTIGNSFFAGQIAQTEAQIAQTQRRIDLYNEEISVLQGKINEEQRLAEDGKNSNVSILREELAAVEEARSAAENRRLAQEKKVAQIRLRQDAAETASGILLAIVNAIKSSARGGIVGVLAGLSVGATILGFVSRARAQAQEFATPPELRKGGRIGDYFSGKVTKGDSHERGGTPAFTEDGQPLYVEKREYVTNAKSTEAGSNLTVLERINAGEFDNGDLNKIIDRGLLKESETSNIFKETATNTQSFLNTPIIFPESQAPVFEPPIIKNYLTSNLKQLKEAQTAAEEAQQKRQREDLKEAISPILKQLIREQQGTQEVIRKKPTYVSVDGRIIKVAESATGEYLSSSIKPAKKWID